MLTTFTPERLKAFEFGYKGIIGDAVLADINYHKTYYTDMFGGVVVAFKKSEQLMQDKRLLLAMVGL